MGKDDRWFTSGVFYTILVIIVVSGVLGIYFLKFNGDLSSDINDWSGFGSYLGGALGSALTLITLIIVIQTYKLQAKELFETRKVHADSKDVLEKQKLENTFYSLLREKNSLLNSEFVPGKTIRREVRDCSNRFRTQVDTNSILKGKNPIKKLEELVINEYYLQMKNIFSLNNTMFKIVLDSKISEEEKNFNYSIIAGNMCSGELELYLVYSISKIFPGELKAIITKLNLFDEKYNHEEWTDIVKVIRASFAS